MGSTTLLDGDEFPLVFRLRGMMILEVVTFDDWVSRLLDMRVGVETLNDIEPTYLRLRRVSHELP